MTRLLVIDGLSRFFVENIFLTLFAGADNVDDALFELCPSGILAQAARPFLSALAACFVAEAGFAFFFLFGVYFPLPVFLFVFLFGRPADLRIGRSRSNV